MASPLTQDQRNQVAEKIMELGNYAATGMVLVQFLSGQFHLWLFLFGAAIFLESYYFAYCLMKGGEH